MKSRALVGGDRSRPRHRGRVYTPRAVAIASVLIAFAGTLLLFLIIPSFLTMDQTYIVRPLVVACGVFATFCCLLRLRTKANLFGEIGFVYLSLALAYTFFPAVAFLATDFTFPLVIDGFNFVDLSPLPSEFGAHFWRLVLFIAGVAFGYLVVRGGPVEDPTRAEQESPGTSRLIAVWMTIVGCCIVIVTLLSAPVTSYLDHYARFDNLSWLMHRVVYVCLMFKTGGYFVLLALMFRRYTKYRKLIFVIVPAICAYETIYSFGSRIEALIVLLAFVSFYNYRVSPVSMTKGVAYLTALAALFSAIELFRASDFSLSDAQFEVSQDGAQQATEFGAVYNTSFHLYSERERGTLPPRPWPMFFNEFITIVPFVDHTKYNPQYWYYQNYFPDASVPPQTMGVIADSAIWGGEVDLLFRSLANGALYALLTRWFLARKRNFNPTIVYVYCYASCVMTLKYSVLYPLIPLVQIILPTLLLAAILSRIYSPRRAVPRGAI